MTGSIFAFIGVIGSGKDYRASMLMAEGFVRLDFKDELLDMVSDLVGADVRKDYQAFKDNIVGCMDSHPRHAQKAFLELYPNAMTGRRLLQRFGTDLMRARDRDYWVNAFKKRVMSHLEAGRNVVCADCRFLNEVEAIKALDPDARFVFCNYRSNRYVADMRHHSEFLAQALLSHGLGDGDGIMPDDFAAAAEIMEGPR